MIDENFVILIFVNDLSQALSTVWRLAVSDRGVKRMQFYRLTYCQNDIGRNVSCAVGDFA